jgi:hypothetical protein
MTRFIHLQILKVSYTKHFKHSMYYSFQSLKSSYYFFVHAIYPDYYTTNGSTTIKQLNETINGNSKRS